MTNQGAALSQSSVPRARRRQFTPVPEPDLTEVAGRLLQARTKAGLSTRELADAAGVSQSTVVGLEDAAAPATSLRVLVRLADALRVPREWLCFGVVGVVTPKPKP